MIQRYRIKSVGNCHQCNLYLFISLLCQSSAPCSKKGATKLMAVTSSNLNRFSKFFHHWKEKEISNKYVHYFPPHLKYVAALSSWIQKFKFVIKLPNKNKTRIIFVKKIKVSFIWLNGYCYYHKSCSKCPTSANAQRCPRHSSIALSMTLWSIPCQTCIKCYY